MDFFTKLHLVPGSVGDACAYDHMRIHMNIYILLFILGGVAMTIVGCCLADVGCVL